MKTEWKIMIVLLVALIFTRIPVQNKELVTLQLENLRLDNEIKLIQRQKNIKNEMEFLSAELKILLDDEIENDSIHCHLYI